jgi:glucose/arabinose dehydrogenase
MTSRLPAAKLLQEKRHRMRRFPVFILLLLACAGDDSTGEDPGNGPPQPPGTGVRLVQIAEALSSPVFLTAPPNDPRLFIVEQTGRIRIMRNDLLLDSPFLDIRSKVATGGERGLLGLAFHPNYAVNGFFYVNYTDVHGNTKIERYSVSAGDPNTASSTSAKLILTVPQPYPNHNGGMIAFGPDGKLYIGMGDGGSSGDPLNHGQDRTTLLGDLLRIDVDAGDPYAIPLDNPYSTSNQFRREIWASGLRNPWRFSFDRTAGMLYVADVGQGQWEEINAVGAGQAAVNYGWRVLEGSHCFKTEICDRTGLTLPVHEYGHTNGACSVTGGYVYRGSRIPSITGHYFFSDYCAGFIRSFKLVNGVATDHRTWPFSDINRVTSFGEDANRELYVMTGEGRLYRFSPQ